MSATVSTDFLLRVAQATPEQQAAIERIMNGGATAGHPFLGAGDDIRAALRRIERKLDAVREVVAGGREPVIEISENEARKAFLLMKRLEGGGPKQWKAPMATVFRLAVLEGHSQRRTARLCGCVPALISRRVKTIESQFGMSIERLRNYASAIVEMEAAVKGPRTRKKNHGASTDEPPQYEDGPGRPDLVEDDKGYLPDERAEDGL